MNRARLLQHSYWLLGIILLAASIYFHATYPYLKDKHYGLTSVCIIIFSFLWMVLFLRRHCPPVDQAPDFLSGPLRYVSFLVFGAAFLLLVCSGISEIPIWSEEVWWIEWGKMVLNGTIVSFMGFKADNPSNAQAWPVAAALAICRDPLIAGRFVGALYQVFLAFLVIETISIYIGRRAYWSYALMGTSLLLVHWSRIGYHDNLSVPFLITGQIYFLSRLLFSPDRRGAVGFVFFAGVSFWTLYTPFVFSLISFGALAVAPSRLLSLRSRGAIAFSFLVVVGCTIGKVIQYPRQSLRRHIGFARGGEWGIPEDYDPLVAYISHFKKLLFDIAPAWPPKTYLGFSSLFAANLEMGTFALFILGLATLPFMLSRTKVLYLYGSFLLMLAGYIVSNPLNSTWRQLCLVPFIFIVAGIFLENLGRWRWASMLIPIFIALNLSWFVPRYLAYSKKNWQEMPVPLNARRFVPAVQETVDQQIRIVVAQGWIPRHIQSYFDQRISFVRVLSQAQAENLIQQPGKLAFLMSGATEDRLNPERLKQLMRSRAREFRVIEFERGKYYPVGMMIIEK